ncbi:DUF4105 domain-containing protein [Microvenator marinus]|uniref:DUF4105 domain-containing protein n=1 Tax=Microvenator marinus TaxID=2600177 RepID=A0A5B8XQH9_9DELT|nr:DUF4105 domain-containing protein [Microvenator marinus]QED27850.1 DUF4105 domain-containing protein [Microvenator marinus]
MTNKHSKTWRALTLLLTLPLGALVGLTVTYTGALGGPLILWRAGLGALLGLVIVAAPFVFGRKQSVSLILSIAASVGFFWATHEPSNQRQWSPIASKTAYAEIEGSKVHLKNVRNFRHHEDGTAEQAWYDATYDVSEIEQGYFVMTTFGGIEGLAHVMVSFKFKGERYVVMSVEIRREVGEEYHPVGGMFRQFELYYVVADERDALALRTHVHKDPTWLIPMNAGPEKTGEFFMDMVRRANELHTEPQWYNSITSSCASNLADHYEVINNVSLPPDYRILLPGFSGEILAELDLLPEGMSVEDAMASFRVDEKARALELDDHWSTRIRD